MGSLIPDLAGYLWRALGSCSNGGLCCRDGSYREGRLSPHRLHTRSVKKMEIGSPAKRVQMFSEVNLFFQYVLLVFFFLSLVFISISQRRIEIFFLRVWIFFCIFLKACY